MNPFTEEQQEVIRRAALSDATRENTLRLYQDTQDKIAEQAIHLAKVERWLADANRDMVGLKAREVFLGETLGVLPA